MAHLAKASIWPDEVRKALPQMNPLHYVDVPRGETKYDRERDCPQWNCIVEAITWYLNVLKSNDSPLAESVRCRPFFYKRLLDTHQNKVLLISSDQLRIRIPTIKSSQPGRQPMRRAGLVVNRLGLKPILCVAVLLAISLVAFLRWQLVPPALAQSVYNLRIHAIVLSDDNGSEPSTITPLQVVAWVNKTNAMLTTGRSKHPASVRTQSEWPGLGSNEKHCP